MHLRFQGSAFFFGWLLLLLGCFGLVRVGQSENQPPLAHWKLDEREGAIVDSQGTASPGTAVNGVEYGQPGRVGTALGFDGKDDFIDVGMIPRGHALQLSSGGTISAWFKQQPGARWQRMVDKSSNRIGANGYALMAEPLNRSILLCVNGQAYGSQPGVYELDEWTHVAAVMTGSVFGVYVNGHPVRGRFLIGNAQLPPDMATSMQIGTWPLGRGRELNGFLDDIRIYDTVLTDEEIKELAGVNGDRDGDGILDAVDTTPTQGFQPQVHPLYFDGEEKGFAFPLVVDDPLAATQLHGLIDVGDTATSFPQQFDPVINEWIEARTLHPTIGYVAAGLDAETAGLVTGELSLDFTLELARISHKNS